MMGFPPGDAAAPRMKSTCPVDPNMNTINTLNIEETVSANDCNMMDTIVVPPNPE